MSGLSRTPGKRVGVNTPRGFESRPLRQSHVRLAPQTTKPFTPKPRYPGLFRVRPAWARTYGVEVPCGSTDLDSS